MVLYSPHAPPAKGRPQSPSNDAATIFFDLANSERVQYKCKAGLVVDVRQNRDVKDSTGGIVWEAAFLLATFLESRGPKYLGWCAEYDDDWESANTKTGKKESCEGRSKKKARREDDTNKVLEVGAGCGLLGLVLARLGCDVTMTEVPVLMDNLKANAESNGGGSGKIKVQQLDWTCDEDLKKAQRLKPFDIIVGTDVIFNKNLVEPLLRVLHSCCHEASTVWLCVGMRCPAAHAEFVERAADYFDSVVDRTEQLRACKGCEAAKDLEQILLRLTKRKVL